VSDELPGYTEATSGPSAHRCQWTLVDTVIGERQIILICYECKLYWHTGIVEGVRHETLSTIKLAAERRYRRAA
jgi:hypothetical protein